MNSKHSSKTNNTFFENTILNPNSETSHLKGIQKPLNGRRTKIICTIGPVTKPVEILCSMIKAGMNVARLNFSHGSHQYHSETIKNIRKAVSLTNLPCAILLDTKGPEIRTGMLKNGTPVRLTAGQKLKIHCSAKPDFLGDASQISVDYKRLGEKVRKGTIIKIDDGIIHVRVDEAKKAFVVGTVLNDQELGEKKGVNLPGIDTGLPAMTEKDKKDILFGVEHKVDIIAPSFINCAQDVVDIKAILGARGAYIKIISKIESEKGLDNFDEILKVSDGIMIARGDLGVEIPFEKVCVAQKAIIHKCNAVGKPVVTATQMLDSMIKNPIPTRAEVADVSNAVFDGTDCVMLSGESAKGSHPIEAASVMARICRETEISINYKVVYRHMNNIAMRPNTEEELRTETVTSAAVKIAIELNAEAIFVLTDSGKTACFVSKYMPPMPILCVTPNQLTVRQSMIRKGIWPIHVQREHDDEHRFEEAKKIALMAGWCKAGDCVIIISGKHGVSDSCYNVRVVSV